MIKRPLHEGDIIDIEMERVPVFEDPHHVPSYKVTTKRFKVRRIGPHGIRLRPTRKSKKIRGWRLDLNYRYLNSSTKPPLRYEVLQIDLVE